MGSSDSRYAAGTGAAVVAALLAAGCGVVTIGEKPNPSTSLAAVPTWSGTAGSSQTSPPPQASPRLSPGRNAPAGCGELVGPLYQLWQLRADPERSRPERATGLDAQAAAQAAEVQRLASGVADNALGAVARRMAAGSAPQNFSADAMNRDWDQVRTICQLD